MAKGLFGALKGIDAFGKTAEDVKVRTRTGALLTLLSLAFILTFMTVEFIDYRRMHVDTFVVVDRSRGEKLTVRFNVTFPRVPCFLLSLDVMDISGELQRGISHNVFKSRLDPQGVKIATSINFQLKNDLDKIEEVKKDDYCGSCYGGVPPESGCCQTCEDVVQAYSNRGWTFGNPDAVEQCIKEGWSKKLQEQSNEGCNIAGYVRVNKVIGNIHISPGRSFQASSARNIYELVPYLRDDENRHDFSHTIHNFEFGADDEFDLRKSRAVVAAKKRLDISNNPLDETIAKTSKAQYMFRYFLKVVATQFRTIDSIVVNTHQYSMTHFERDLMEGSQGHTSESVHVAHSTGGIPGVFINYEISPLLVVHKETRQSFAHFLTSSCAIVGGVLTVASIVDGVLFAATRAMKKA